MRRTVRGTSRRRPEDGVAMVSTLAVVIILGIIVTIVISNGPSGPKTTVGGSVVTTTTITVKTVGNDTTAAAISACLASYSEVNTALSYYKTLNGASPPAGTAWATSTTNGSALIDSWPSGAPNYSVSWNGVELTVTPRRGTPSHGTSGSSSPPTGCYAA
jgi:hypothetical protein